LILPTPKSSMRGAAMACGVSNFKQLLARRARVTYGWKTSRAYPQAMSSDESIGTRCAGQDSAGSARGTSSRTSKAVCVESWIFAVSNFSGASRFTRPKQHTDQRDREQVSGIFKEGWTWRNFELARASQNGLRDVPSGRGWHGRFCAPKWLFVGETQQLRRGGVQLDSSRARDF